MSLGFCGCEKNICEESGAADAVNSQTQYVELSAFNQVQALNDSLLMTKTTRMPRWLKNSFIIAGADIAGFGAGAASVGVVGVMIGAATAGTGAMVVVGMAGTICSVGASCQAYDSCYGRTAPYPGSETGGQIIISPIDMAIVEAAADEEVQLNGFHKKAAIDLPEKFETLNEVEVLHNAMLEKIDDVKAGQLKLSDIDVNVDPELMKIVESEKFSEAYDAIVNAVSTAQGDFETIDIDEFCGALGVKITDNAAKVYKLFLEVYDQIPGDVTDVKYLIDEYIKIIENSPEFTDEDKIQIYGGLSVAANSPSYWQDKVDAL